MKYVYPAVFYPEGDGSYSILFPNFKGCVTQGDNLYDALFQAQDSLNFWLDYLEEESKPIPPPTPLKEIAIEENQFVNLIRADTDAWRLLNAQKATT